MIEIDLSSESNSNITIFLGVHEKKSDNTAGFPEEVSLLKQAFKNSLVDVVELTSDVSPSATGSHDGISNDDQIEQSRRFLLPASEHCKYLENPSRLIADTQTQDADLVISVFNQHLLTQMTESSIDGLIQMILLLYASQQNGKQVFLLLPSDSLSDCVFHQLGLEVLDAVEGCGLRKSDAISLLEFISRVSQFSLLRGQELSLNQIFENSMAADDDQPRQQGWRIVSIPARGEESFSINEFLVDLLGVVQLRTNRAIERTQKAREEIGLLKHQKLRLQESLAYRVSRILVYDLRRPQHWPLLPVKLYKTYTEHKLQNVPILESQKNTYLAAYRDGGKEQAISRVKGHNAGNSPKEISVALCKVGAYLSENGYAEAEHELNVEAVEVDTNYLSLKSLFWSANTLERYDEACDAISMCEEVLSKNWIGLHREGLAELRSKPAYKLSDLKLIGERRTRSFVPNNNHVCYVLHNSLPFSSGGYATRSHGLAKGLRELGYSVTCVTRPGYPLDIESGVDANQVPLDEIIEGIRYVRILKPCAKGRKAYRYVRDSAKQLEKTFLELKPEFVIAASNSRVGLIAMIAARRLGIPFVYEARGFWEITRLSRDPDYLYTDAFAVQSQLEAQVAQHADHVFTLTGPMREELGRRGVDKEGITLLPNSCNVERFSPVKRDKSLSEKLDIPGTTPVIGYIGTFVDYEGLDDLVRACILLKRAGTEFRLLLVGSENTSGNDEGPITSAIRQLARNGGLEDWVIVTGRVPHHMVEAYYSLIDIVPFPRKPLPVCEMVSPMKPLEALSMEKAVVVSSVRALSEMIEDGHTGLVYEKGSARALASTLGRLLNDKPLRRKLGENGRQWVSDNRKWEKTAKTLSRVLENFDTTANEPFPAWWGQVPDAFAQRCSYRSVVNWKLSSEAQFLKAEYVAKFNEADITQKIPMLNWKRADICARIVPRHLPLLDVGSGLGEFVNLYAQINPQTPVASIDKRDWDFWFDATGRIERSYEDLFNLDLSYRRDVVTCFEVIEHLPSDRVKNAVDVLRKIAAKKLFISIPFMEPLPLYRGHFTRFEVGNLLELFPDAKFTVFGKNEHSSDKVMAWILCEISTCHTASERA